MILPTAHSFIAASLDGFIAPPDGSLDWLEPYQHPEEDYGYGAFIERMDALVMGRHTFETVAAFADWPYEKPVIVLSSTLKAEDLQDAKIRKLHVANSVMAALELGQNLGFKTLYADGGQTVQSFIQQGALRELILSQIPILLGSGRPLFGPLTTRLSLVHESTKAFKSGLVQSRYLISQ